MCEKAWSMPLVTIPQRPENSQVGMHFVHKWLRKNPYALCRSCRGMLDLQLLYSNVGVLQFNFLEINPIKVCQDEMFCTLGVQSAPPAPASRVAAPRPPTGPECRGMLPTIGPCAAPGCSCA
jgi:hypothetical protein